MDEKTLLKLQKLQNEEKASTSNEQKSQFEKKKLILQMKAIINLHLFLHVILEYGEKHTQTLLGMDQFTVVLDFKEVIYVSNQKNIY